MPSQIHDAESIVRIHKLKLHSMVQEAGRAAVTDIHLSPTEAEFLIQQNGDLANQIKETIQHALREFLISDEFSNEQVPSTHAYNSYNRPRSLESQLAILKIEFPDIEFAPSERVIRKPHDAEGFFLVPDWQLFSDQYGEAVERVFKRVREPLSKDAIKRRLSNMCAGELGPDRLRQSELSEKFFKTLSRQQGNPNTLIVPAQFGLRHAGRSARRARALFAENECGIGVFAAAIMLLLHSNRLGGQHDFNILCVGDEYDRAKDGQFESVPVFRAHEWGAIEFMDGPISLALSESSSVTAFLPNG